MNTPPVPQDILDQFLGQKVEVTTQTKYAEWFHGKPYAPAGRKPKTYEEVKIIPADPTIAALQKAAEAEGFNLNIFTGSEPAHRDFKTDRLNAYIDQIHGKPGYRIAALYIS